MRRYWIFLSFLLSNLWYEFAKSNQLAAEEIEFENLVKDGTSLLGHEGRRDELVMLVGVSGNGKSTLSLLLTSSPTLSVELGQGRRCIYKDKNDKIGIQTQTSKTLIPNFISDEESGQILVDNPGFSDTRKNPAFDIAASFFMKTVFDSVKKVKIVIVEDKNSVTFYKSRDAFLKTLSHLARLIPNASALKGSIGLVVTKVDSTDSDEDIISGVTEFLNDTLVGHLLPEREKLGDEASLAEIGKLLDSEIEIINVLLQSENITGIFRTPCKINGTCQSCSDDESLRKLVFEQLQFTVIEDKKNPFHLTVSDTSVLFIANKLLPQTELKFSKLLDTIVSGEFKLLDKNLKSEGLVLKQKLSLIEAEISEMEQFSAALMIPGGVKDFVKRNKRMKIIYNTLLNELSVESYKIWFFCKSLFKEVSSVIDTIKENQTAKILTHCDHSLAEFRALEQIDTFICNISEYQQTSDFKRVVKYINNLPVFLSRMISLGLKETKDINVIRNVTKPSIPFLEQLKKLSCLSIADGAKFKIYKDSGIYSGHFFKLSEMISSAGSVDNSNIYVLASRKVFIDSDWEIRNIHMTIVSPTIEVIGTSSWRLKGADGPTHNDTAAKRAYSASQPGADGASGLPGYSSGSLKIYTHTVLNGKNLKINTQGGKGGKGQDGGRGHDGERAYLREDIEKIIECIYYIKGNSCDTTSKKLSVTVVDYISNTHGIVDAYSRSSIKPTGGGQGGDAGPGGLPGEIFVSKVTGDDFAIKAENGPVGEVGQGGHGGLNCYLRRDTVKCNLYGGSWTVDSCYKKDTECEHFAIAANGCPGSLSPKKSAENKNYFYKEASFEDQIWILLDFAFDKIENSRYKEQESTLISFIKVILRGLVSNNKSVIEFFYRLLNRIALKNIPQEQIFYVLQLVLSEFRYYKNYMFKTEFHGDVVALEALILSNLDLAQTSKNSRLILNAQLHLNTFKNDAERLSSAWRDQFKSAAINTHKKNLQSEIETSKKFTAQTVQENIEKAEQYLQDQFDSLQQKIKTEEEKAMRDIKELRNMKDRVSGNIVKRIIFSVVNFAAGLVSIVNPAVGSLIQAGSNVGEKFTVSEYNNQVGTTPVLGAVRNVRNVISKFHRDRARNRVSRSQHLIGVGQEVLRDKELVKLLKKSTVEKLENAMIKSESAVDSALFVNEKLKDALGTCYTELKKVTNAESSVHLKRSLKLFNIASHVSALSFGVLSDVQKIQGDNDLLGKLDAKIADSSLLMSQLDEYNTNLHTFFMPYINDMQEAFQKFTSSVEGMAQHMLFFRRIDLKKMTRQFVSLIRKFTDGFAEEQQELISVVEDLEMLATEAMNSQAHVNELEYKFQLASLVGTLDSNYQECGRGRKFCEQRKAAWIEVQKNTLLQRYVVLERAFQQAIFPFKSQRQFVGMPPTNSDEKTMIQVLRERVDTMIADLVERNSTIDLKSDKYVRTAVFTSQFSSSTPFYSWHQADHAEQIGRFLRGERVNFVADVRHTNAYNAAKFFKIGLNITVPGVPLHSLLSYLELEMVHGGDNHFRCGNRFYAIAAEPLTFSQTFERGEFGQPVSQNAVSSKFAQTEIPFSPYSLWTMQIKSGRNPDSRSKLREIAKYANKASLELHGSGSYVEEGAPICDEDLPKYFDLFI
ncbi:uncharacterized protein LOC135944106 [Cloeon dipterum]|uniref:uncharacterized protein LOC135944106 n=1 Tax=Cloeon dipterum TaxID=197152 RepID=UPI00321F7C35